GHTLRYLGAARAAITSKQRFFPTCYGPDFTVRPENGRLYGDDGLAVLRRALRPDGIAAFWSATTSDPFERVLDAQPWHWRRDDIQLTGGRVDAFHHIYLASAEAGRIGLRAPSGALPALALS
ncbi:hypothetical protein PFB07_23875, partial [Paracoccus sp. AS002]|nr:hypothetical protein [Paracoccus sp. AS002]